MAAQSGAMDEDVTLDELGELTDGEFWRSVTVTAIHERDPAKALAMRLSERVRGLQNTSAQVRPRTPTSASVSGMDTEGLDDMLACMSDFEANTWKRPDGSMLIDEIEYTG